MGTHAPATEQAGSSIWPWLGRRWAALAIAPAFGGVWTGCLYVYDEVDPKYHPWRMVPGDVFRALMFGYVTAPLLLLLVLAGLRLFRWTATAPNIIGVYSAGPGAIAGLIALLVTQDILNSLWLAAIFPVLLWPAPLAYCLIAGVPWRAKRAD